MIISAKRRVMGRPVAEELKPIIMPQSFDIGYGPFQLRPDGSRDVRAECRQLGKLTQKVNGMSGQLTG